MDIRRAEQRKQVILEQIGSRETHATGIERFKYLKGIQFVRHGNNRKEKPVHETVNHGDKLLATVGLCLEPGLYMLLEPDKAPA